MCVTINRLTHTIFYSQFCSGCQNLTFFFLFTAGDRHFAFTVRTISSTSIRETGMILLLFYTEWRQAFVDSFPTICFPLCFQIERNEKKKTWRKTLYLCKQRVKANYHTRRTDRTFWVKCPLKRNSYKNEINIVIYCCRDKCD